MGSGSAAGNLPTYKGVMLNTISNIILIYAVSTTAISQRTTCTAIVWNSHISKPPELKITAFYMQLNNLPVTLNMVLFITL